MKNIRIALTVLGTLLCATPAMAQTQEAATSVVLAASPEQVVAARHMLQAMELAKVVRNGMARAPNLDQETYDAMQHISRNASDREICELLAPIYGKYAPAVEMERLATAYGTSVGRRLVGSMLGMEGMGGGVRGPIFNDSELREARAINALPASKAIVAAKTTLLAESRTALENWRNAYYANYVRQGMNALRELSDALASRKPGDPEPQLKFTRSGMPTLDKVINIMAEHNITIGNAGVALRSDLESYDIGHLLAKERLVSAEGIAQSKRTLAKSEERIERYLRVMDLMQTEYRQRLAKAVQSPKSLASFEPMMAAQYDLLVRIGENQRALTDVFSRVLAFSASRAGKIHLQDDRLMFDDEADLQVFTTMTAQIRALSEEESQLFKTRTGKTS
jgi:hypothetical protein